MWLYWNGTTTDWTAKRGDEVEVAGNMHGKFADAGRFDELYDHSGDTGKDFDSMDVINLAYNSSYAEIVAERFKRAKAFFN